MQAAGADVKDYQLIGAGGVWHLTQQQARPPKRDELACHTSCGKWAEMKDGYQRGRPTCPTCLEHVRVFEKKPVVTADVELDTIERVLDETVIVEFAYRTRSSRRRRAML